MQLSVEADSPWFVPIGDEGQYCLVQGPPNQLHTSDGSPIGPVYSEPTTEPGDRGLYTLVSNHLTFRSVPGGKVLWRLRLPAEVRGVSYLSPWPGHLYVEYGETVYAYS